MMMDEARLALYEQSEANAVFRPKRGDEHESRGEGRRKIRAKCLVCLAWLIKLLLCRLVGGDMMSVKDTDVCL